MLPTAGTLEHISTEHSPTTVSALSFFTFEIKLAHSLLESQGPVVKVMFPRQFQVQQTCERPARCTASLYDNSLSLEGLVKGTHEAGKSLKFTAGPLRLFESTTILQEKFTFVTYMRGKQSDRLYEVDGGSAFPSIEMTPGGFKKIKVTTSSD